MPLLSTSAGEAWGRRGGMTELRRMVRTGTGRRTGYATGKKAKSQSATCAAKSLPKNSQISAAKERFLPAEYWSGRAFRDRELHCRSEHICECPASLARRSSTAIRNLRKISEAASCHSPLGTAAYWAIRYSPAL